MLGPNLNEIRFDLVEKAVSQMNALSIPFDDAFCIVRTHCPKVKAVAYLGLENCFTFDQGRGGDLVIPRERLVQPVLSHPVSKYHRLV